MASNSKTVVGIADAIATSLNGQELTKTQRNLLSSAITSPTVQSVISDTMEKMRNRIDSYPTNVYDEVNATEDLENRQEAALWDLANQRADVFGNEDYVTATEGSVPRQGQNIFGEGNYESGLDALDEIKRIDVVEVAFNYNSKYNETEFARQLADQQKGMKELTVQEYLDNRQKYIEQGRATESNAAQQAAREKAFVDKVDELQDAGLSLKDAEEQAQRWLDTQAALHSPDQVAGGYANSIGGVGDKRVNASIGSQWRYRIDDVDAQIQKMADSMSEAEKNSTYLNVNLTYKGDQYVANGERSRYTTGNTSKI
jgi:hypothetical protein